MSAKKMLEIAQSQVGYLEKKSNYQLDSFTANAGNANWTKYGQWYGLNPAEWCDMFVSWCAAQAGEVAAIGKFAYVPYHVSFFRNKGQYFARGAKTPQAGDIIFFGDEAHVGIVEYVTGGNVHTIEGNTKNANGIGCVMRHSYSVTSTYIMGYGRPAYDGYGGGGGTKTEERYSPWKTWKNGSTPEPVYKDTDRTVMIGTLSPGESCECVGRYGDSYLVSYKLDDTDDDWAVGYVKYNGGI